MNTVLTDGTFSFSYIKSTQLFLQLILILENIQFIEFFASRRQSGFERVDIKMKNKKVNELDDIEEYKKPPKLLVFLGKFLKWLVLACIILMLAAFALRMCEQRTPEELKRLIWTDRTIQAYENSEDSFSAYDCKIQSYYTEDGYFFADSVIAIPSANQWQITISYNNSTLRYLESEYAGDETAESEATETVEDKYGIYSAEPFIYILYDSEGNVYDSYSYISDSSALHSFRRLIFDDVPTDSVGGLSLAIFRARDITQGAVQIIGNGDGELAPWREIVIYNELSSLETHKISNTEAYTGVPANGLTKVENAVGTNRVNVKEEESETAVYTAAE